MGKVPVDLSGEFCLCQKIAGWDHCCIILENSCDLHLTLKCLSRQVKTSEKNAFSNSEVLACNHQSESGGPKAYTEADLTESVFEAIRNQFEEQQWNYILFKIKLKTEQGLGWPLVVL